MAATKCPKCERVIKFHARGQHALDMACTSKRCGTEFQAHMMGNKWNPNFKEQKRKPE